MSRVQYLTTNASLVGIVATSAACQPARFERAINFLEASGCRVKIFGDPCAAYGKADHLFSSASAVDRARFLLEAFEDPQVAVVLAARGAYGTAELLEPLEKLAAWEKIAALPKKPFVGFSDSTVLLVALSQLANVPSVHGPSLESAFSKAATDSQAAHSCKMLLEFLRGEPTPPIKLEHLYGPTSAQQGKIVGGNLSVVCSLLGTRFEVDSRGKFLFIEEIGEKPYRVHRMLLQLRLAGRFSGCLGVLLGQFSGCVHVNGHPPQIAEVLKDVLAGLGIPVFQGVPSGHELLNLPLPFGVQAKVEGDRLTF